jgi:hypothetical protein
VVDFVRSNGGYISEKVEVRIIGGDLAGIFAKEPLQKNELAYEIPFNLTIFDNTYCGAVQKIRNLMIDDATITTPYEKYLSTRTSSHHFLPALFSSQGQQALNELLGETWRKLGYMGYTVEKWWKKCGSEFGSVDEIDDKNRRIIGNAIAVVYARGEGAWRYIPVHDLSNHASDEAVNVEYEFNHKRVQSRARRYVEAGEELATSYSECKECYDGRQKDRTPWLFLSFGFLESMPQRWYIPQSEVYFELAKMKTAVGSSSNNDDLQVRFLSEHPSDQDLALVRKEIDRLKTFELDLTTKWATEHSSMPLAEWKAIHDFCKATLTALEHVLKVSEVSS